MKDFCKEDIGNIKRLVSHLSRQQFSQKLISLSSISIGQHIRHIIEFYQCLLTSEHSQNVCYDNRKRNPLLENSVVEAALALENLESKLELFSGQGKLTILGNFSKKVGMENMLTSSVERELAYCLEHSIHHQALIKVGLMEMNMERIIDRNFGVAPATQKFRQECVQ